MELVYLWISKYKNIENQGFNLNSKWQVEYDYKKKELTVEKRNPQPIANFFGEHISNVTAIVGENGAGKSSLMDLLVLMTSFEQGYIHQDFVGVFADGNDLQYTSNMHIPNISIPLESEMLKNKRAELKTFESLYYSPMPILEPNLFQIMVNNSSSKNRHDITDRSFYNCLVVDSVSDTRLFNHTQIMQKINFLQTSKKNEKVFKFPTHIKIMMLDFKSQIKKYNIPEQDVIYIDSFVEELITKDNNMAIKIKKKLFKLILFNLMVRNKPIKTILRQIKKIFNEKKLDINVFLLNIKEKLDIRFLIGDFEKFLLTIDDIFSIESTHDLIFDISDSNIKKIFFLAKNELYIDDNIILYIFDYPDLDLYSFEWCDYNGDIYTLSGGEEHELLLFSRLFYRTDLFWKYDFIFIDEGDLGLHPTWQVSYLQTLIEAINIRMESVNSFRRPKIHLIITTHSPFVLSDLPRENVVFLEKDKDGKCQVVKNPMERPQTFASNIHTLFAEGFFMREGTIGHFAKSKIEKVLTYLSKDPKEMNDKGKSEYEEITKIINLIGEPLIKNKLLRMIQDRNTLTVDERINNLQAQIDELKKQK
jgi:ABC-type dipeptide/oligopeptide/nickel transport system ATPase component